jgi:anti-anti-sigma factor
MEIPLRCWNEQRAGVVIVHVAGEVDLATEAGMTDEMLAAVDAGPALIVADLTKVTFFGSCGINALLLVQERAEKFQRRLVLALGDSAARRSIEIAGLGQVLAVHHSVEDALAGP